MDRRIHAGLHAGDVEHRQRAQHHAALLRAAPVEIRHGGRLHARMGVHAAFWLPRRARGIRHHGEVLGRRDVRARGEIRLERSSPRIGYRRRTHEGGQRQIGFVGQIVRIAGNQHVLEIQRLDLRRDVLSGDRDARPGVGDVMAQFLGAVHRIHRHDDGVRAQHRVERDDELGAVLEVKQHPVAARHAAAALKEPGERVHLPLELAVGQPLPVVVDRRALRLPRRARRQVRVHRFARQRERPGLTGRPVREVPVEHQIW